MRELPSPVKRKKPFSACLKAEKGFGNHSPVQALKGGENYSGFAAFRSVTMPMRLDTTAPKSKANVT